VNLDHLYQDVVARLEGGLWVSLDDLVKLDAAGYVLPLEGGCEEDCPDCADEAEEEEEVSPNEVTVSFFDYAHDTAVDVVVDMDGDFIIREPDQDYDGILLSPAGAMRLAEILADALAAEEVA
jgi:hypothetical protein